MKDRHWCSWASVTMRILPVQGKGLWDWSIGFCSYLFLTFHTLISLYILWRSTPTLASLLRESEISLWASKKTLRLALWWHGEFVKQSRASSVGDHFLYSQDPNIWFRGYVVRRNLVLVTLKGQRVKNVISHEGFAKYCISVGGWFLLAAGYFWLPLLSYHHRLNLPATIILLHKLWMVGKP